LAEPEDIPGRTKQATPWLADILLRLLPSRSYRPHNLLALVGGSLLLAGLSAALLGRTEGYAAMFVVASAC
jgi:hypothetical protein